jgi:hypothetical protein
VLCHFFLACAQVYSAEENLRASNANLIIPGFSPKFLLDSFSYKDVSSDTANISACPKWGHPYYTKTEDRRCGYVANNY